MKKLIHLAWPSIFVGFCILAGWEFFVRQGIIPSYLLSQPTQVLSVAWDLRQDLASAFLSTALSTFWGLLLSFIVGNLLALLFTTIPFLQRAFLPFSIFFQTVPIVAIAPLLVIWFGFGSSTVRAAAFIVSVFPVLANTMVGLSSTDRKLEELFSLYHATKWKRLWHLQIPAAFSYIFAGLRIAAGLAVIGAIVGEFIAGGGLGSLIDSARTQQRIDLVFAAVGLSSVLGLFFVALVHFLRLAFLRYKPFEEK